MCESMYVCVLVLCANVHTCQCIRTYVVFILICIHAFVHVCVGVSVCHDQMLHNSTHVSVCVRSNT